MARMWGCALPDLISYRWKGRAVMLAERLDGRWKIRREWCGYATPRWVVRFCGEWVGQFPSEPKARAAARAHRKGLFG